MGRLSEALAEEISLLKSARNFNNGKTKRTVYGVSGLEINEIATLMQNFIIDQSISSPSKEKSLGQMLKFASDDLKVWYYEAAGKKARTTGKRNNRLVLARNRSWRNASQRGISDADVK